MSVVHDDMVSRGNYVQAKIWRNVSKIIMYGDCVRDYIYRDFIVDLAVLSSLCDAILNAQQ